MPIQVGSHGYRWSEWLWISMSSQNVVNPGELQPSWHQTHALCPPSSELGAQGPGLSPCCACGSISFSPSFSLLAPAGVTTAADRSGERIKSNNRGDGVFSMPTRSIDGTWHSRCFLTLLPPGVHRSQLTFI